MALTPSSAEMVMIACKAPNGVVLNLLRYQETKNGHVVSNGSPATVTLKGWSFEWGKPDPGAETGGYVLTSVPRDFWDQWIATHPEFPMLLDKTIIGPHRDAIGQAKALADVPKMHAPSKGEIKALEDAKLVVT